MATPQGQLPAQPPAPPALPDLSDLSAQRWTIEQAPAVKNWYRSRFGKELPVSAFGESQTHERMGLDHRESFDVALAPSSAEGRELIEFLQSSNIPHRAITAADVAAGVKATGEHIHVGEPSHGLGAPASGLPDLSDLSDGAQASALPDLSDLHTDDPNDTTAPRWGDPYRYSPISKDEFDNIERVDTAIDAKTGQPLAPDDPRRISGGTKFQQGDPLANSGAGVRAAVDVSKWANNAPDLPRGFDVGAPVKVRVPAGLNDEQTYAALSDAALKALGPDAARAGQFYRQQTGRNLAQPAGSFADLKPVPVKDEGGHVVGYEVTLTPKRHLVDIVNALNSGGLDAAQRVSADLAQQAHDYDRAYDERPQPGVVKQVIGDTIVSDAQLAHNATELVRGSLARGSGIRAPGQGFDEWQQQEARDQEMLDAARASLPRSQSSTQQALRTVGDLAAKLPQYALAGEGAPLMMMVESAHEGPQQMFVEGLKGAVAQGAGRAAKGLLVGMKDAPGVLSAHPVLANLAARGAQGATFAAQGATDPQGRTVRGALTNFGAGAILPVGAPERAGAAEPVERGPLGLDTQSPLHTIQWRDMAGKSYTGQLRALTDAERAQITEAGDKPGDYVAATQADGRPALVHRSLVEAVAPVEPPASAAPKVTAETPLPLDVDLRAPDGQTYTLNTRSGMLTRHADGFQLHVDELAGPAGVGNASGPKPPETLQTQLEALKAGARAVVTVTAEQQNDPAQKAVVPKGMRSFGTPEGGRIIYNPEQVERAEVVRRMDDGTLNEWARHMGEARANAPSAQNSLHRASATAPEASTPQAGAPALPTPVADELPPGWEYFPEHMQSLNVPRASMPQIKSEHRGAMVQFLRGRGISHTQEEVAPASLRPAQVEFSPEKVDRARGFAGPQRSILVSADNYVVDGHHQWLADLTDAPDKPIPVIRLNAPIQQLLIEVARFPSAGVDEAGGKGGSAAQPGRARQVLGAPLDVAAAPRSIMTSADLSAPGRQGLIFTVTHPVFAARAMARQVWSFVSQHSHDELMRWLVTHPDADTAERAGLYSAMKEHASLSGREEAFMSRLAGKLPVVKQSERAYVAYLDSLRQDVFSKYAKQLEQAGLNEFDNPEEFKSLARFINSATGRGELPAALQKLAPVLNATMFAPRNLKGRIDVLNPYYYAKLAPAARKIALQQMTQFAGTVVAGLTLAHLAGAKTTLNPADPDFGKVVVGHTHYDFTGGQRSVVRYVLQMSKAFAGLAQGQSAQRNQDVLALTTRFLRQNAAPVPAYIADAATGKTVSGQDFKAQRDVLRLVTPLVAQDLYEGWQDEGGRGLLKAAPAVLGVGVQTYAARPTNR